MVIHKDQEKARAHQEHGNQGEEGQRRSHQGFVMAARSTPWSRLPPSGESPREQPLAVRTIAVIGAGSSGLVAAKHLRDAGYIVTVYERTSCIGGAFVHKAYDEAKLVSSKYLTSFSDLRPKPSDPPHLSLAAYVDYLREYTRQEKLLGLITFGAHVSSVHAREDGQPGYTVCVEPVEPAEAYPAGEGGAAATPFRLREPATQAFDAVCVCSGLHEVPYAPRIDGIERYTGVAMHSAQYKERSCFANKRVLVIGCGETGMDLAYRAVQVASSVCLSIKRGFLSVPHEGWGGVPLDTLISNLFEHSYEHWWCHKHHFKWRVTSVVIRLMFFLSTGSSVGYNQYVGRLADVKRGHHILCKSTAAMPYLNRPVKSRSWRRWLWWWAEPAVDKSIASAPAPQSIDGRTVTFADGTTFDADVLVYATGYRQTFPFLHTDETAAPTKGGGARAAGAGRRRLARPSRRCRGGWGRRRAAAAHEEAPPPPLPPPACGARTGGCRARARVGTRTPCRRSTLSSPPTRRGSPSSASSAPTSARYPRWPSCRPSGGSSGSRARPYAAWRRRRTRCSARSSTTVWTTATTCTSSPPRSAPRRR